MINNTDFPILLFSSYNKDNAPTELPFRVPDKETEHALSSSKGFQELLGLIGTFNTVGQKPEHHWLNNKLFGDIENSQTLRNTNFNKFLSAQAAQVHYGTISFMIGGQYLYLYLPRDKGEIKESPGGYLASALFKNNLFVGFEEAFIMDKGFSVLPDGL